MSWGTTSNRKFPNFPDDKQDFTTPQAYVARIQEGLKSRYNASINDFASKSRVRRVTLSADFSNNSPSLGSHRDEWKDTSIETSSEWASVSFAMAKPEPKVYLIRLLVAPLDIQSFLR